MSFRGNKLEQMAIPMNIVMLIAAINEYKGKQDLYKQQSPQILETLRSVAVIQSTKASNSLEGIVTNDKRLKEIVEKKVTPQNRSEGEIAGYRDVLATIHASHEAIPINCNIILQLHRDLYKFLPIKGGTWKNADNIIEETLPDGTKLIRFRPTSAFETPMAMDELCNYLRNERNKEKVEPLILTGTFIFDFLCIHPFNDGNGRMARLLTLLLLYQFGYEVGRFISLEKIVEESKESYYATLAESSIGWHEEEHNIFIWLEYFLGIVLAAYKEFEERVGVINLKKGKKNERIENMIEHTIGEFNKEEIRNACPDVAESTINRVLEKLKGEGKIVSMGKGRNAKWKKIL